MQTRTCIIRGFGLLLIGCAALAAEGGKALVPPSEQDESPEAGGASRIPRVVFDLATGDAAGKTQHVMALGGRTLAVSVTGDPGARCTVQLGYQDTVVRQATVSLDPRGLGSSTIALPDVRARVACALAVVGRPKLSRTVIVYPSAPLAGAARMLGEQRLGVLDERGRLQSVLRSQGTPFEDLSTRLLADSFDGRIVLIAGVADPNVLCDLCRRFESRARNGLRLILLDPPDAWRGWGAGVRRLDPPRPAPVVLSKELAASLVAEDLGNGPWQRALHLEPPWRVLARVRLPDGERSKTPTALIVERALGKGRVAVATLPCVEDPRTDAVGRSVASTLVLGAIARPAGGRVAQ